MKWLAPFLRHPDFRRLCAGSAWHSASFQGEQVLVGLLVYRLTGSTTWVGVVYALNFLPMLLVGLPAGLTADRFDRRRLLPLFEAVAALLMGLLAVAFAAGLGSLTLLLVAAGLTGSVRALHHPVRLSYAHDVLGREHLVGALGLLSVVARFGQLGGALVAGWLLAEGGPVLGYAALAVMHLLALLSLLRLAHGGRPKDEVAQPLAETLREYVHEMRHNPALWRLTVLASAVEVLGFSFATALPELATERLGTGAEGLGLLHAARSAGGLLAGLLLARLGALRHTGRVYMAVIAGFGVALLLLAGAPSLPFALLAVALVASCAASCDVLVQTMLQLCVADHLRGRAMGAWVLALGAGPLGHVQVGGLAALLTASTALAFNGALLLALAAWVAVRADAIRRL